MEDYRQQTLWLIEAIVQQWLVHVLWLAMSGVLAVLGVLMFGRRYKQRIAALEAEAKKSAALETEAKGSVVINGNVQVLNVSISPDGMYTATVKGGEGEIVSPVPIEVAVGEHLGLSDSFEAVLIPGDKKDD